VASPLLHQIKGGIKPLKFIEDAAVPIQNLSYYIIKIKSLLKKYGVGGACFGHAGNGHIHINPRLNPRIPKEQALLRLILTEQTDLVCSLGGTLSGEHGDGILRSQALKKQYGPLVEVFKTIKYLLDPQNLLNPGKILNEDPQAPMKNWKYDIRAGEQNQDFRKWVSQNQPYWELLDQCHGCGLCRNYCPVFQEGREEVTTGRAKAHLIRGLLSGHYDKEDPTLQNGLKQCGDCRLCSELCPTQIDIASLCRQTRLKIC